MDLRSLLMFTHTGREAAMWKNECPITLETSQKISMKRSGLGTKWFSWMSAQPGASSLLCDHEIRLGQKGHKWTTALSMSPMSCVILKGCKTSSRLQRIDIAHILHKRLLVSIYYLKNRQSSSLSAWDGKILCLGYSFFKFFFAFAKSKSFSLLVCMFQGRDALMHSTSHIQL